MKLKGEFAGRKVIITGGAAGLGLSTAQALVSEGAAVALLDLDGAGVEAAARALSGKRARAFGVVADVTDPASVEHAVAAARLALGPIDGLFNNAGVAALGSVHDSTLESWERVWAVGVTGTFLASRAVLPEMIERKRGVIVNMGSVAGMVGIPEMAAYCAAKGAIVNLTRQMAADYSKHGVRVNCVCPGTVSETAMGRSLLSNDRSEEASNRRVARYPIGRFGTPGEIAAAVTFLLSDAASFCLGSIFTVDGGMTSI